MCHRPCGTAIQCHHILQRSDGGGDTADNCIPLCLDCHSAVGHYNPKHPIGTKITASELRRHRDNWYTKVKETGAWQANEEHLKQDRVLYARIKRILRPSWFIGFFRETCLFDTFPLARLEPMERFLARCRDPHFEFLDATVESRKGLLRAELLKLNRVLCTHHTDDGKGEFVSHWLQSMRREWLDNDSFDEAHREALRETEEAMTSAYKAYGEYVRTARRRLGV